jgi:hypothetical protein
LTFMSGRPDSPRDCLRHSEAQDILVGTKDHLQGDDLRPTFCVPSRRSNAEFEFLRDLGAGNPKRLSRRGESSPWRDVA